MKKLLFSLCIICLIMSCVAAYADNAPVKEWTFENLSSFECNVDYVLGAAYPEKNVSLSNAYNHTLGGGTSVELKNRTKPEYRFKLTNAFNDSDRGKTFEIEAWIYAPNMSGEVSIGTYGDAGSKYAYAPMAKNSINVPKGEWTRITLEYTHEETTISQVGIDQKTGKAPIDILYVDDIKIYENGSSNSKLEIVVNINSEKVRFTDATPQIINSRTLVPMRKIFEEMHCIINWDDASKTVTAVKGDKTIKLTIGSLDAFLNDEKIVLDTPPQIVNDRTMVPVRFIAESLNADVKWNDTTKTVDIYTASENTVNIYRESLKQKFDGFGVSANHNAWYLQNETNADIQKEVLNSLFSDEGKSAAFSILRFEVNPFADGDKSNLENEMQKTINPQKDVWDFDTDIHQRWMADEALKINPDLTFLASVWSPPSWMKQNKSVIGKTQAKNSLASENYEDFANYLAVWADKYKNEYGYNLKWLSVQNEPKLDTVYASCLYSNDELAKILNTTYKKFNEKGLDVLLGASEGASINETHDIMKSFDNETLKNVGFVPAHSYGYTEETLKDFDLSSYNVPVIQTEFNLGPNVKKQYVIDEGIDTALQIADCLNNGYSGWLYWYGSRKIDTDTPGNSESLIDYNNETGKILYGKEFYAIVQFSQFIKPEDNIISSFSENDDVKVVSSINNETKKVSVVLINDTQKEITLNINGLNAPYKMYFTDKDNDFEEAKSATNTITLKPMSVTTLCEN